jgi:acetoin utilization deacetylase AcuC-like enzyme
MALSIFSNQKAFEPKEVNDNERHLGTRDRANPSRQYDFPGKGMGCLAAARQLEQLTAPPHEGDPLSQWPAQLTDGAGVPLPRIALHSSHREPPPEQLLKAHDPQYLEDLENVSAKAQQALAQGGDPYISDFATEADVTPGTFRAAKLAVGASFDMIDTILASSQQTGFALVWPPGHHAERSLAMGFCYLSNAGLAALYARDHSLHVRPGHSNRVVVIDIDHHRGNGTASVLANEPDTLFVDISYRSPYDAQRQRFTDGRYDPAVDRYPEAGKEFPYSRPDTDHGLIAHPMASAPNIISLEFEGIQDDHRIIMDRFIAEVVPKVIDFRPDVVLWSVGLDSAQGDPLGGLGNLPSSFYTFIRGMRIALPDARHGALLEGGYDEQRWFTCLPPALLALHDEPRDNKDRCATFRQYRDAFEAQGDSTCRGPTEEATF